MQECKGQVFLKILLNAILLNKNNIIKMINIKKIGSNITDLVLVEKEINIKDTKYNKMYKYLNFKLL